MYIYFSRQGWMRSIRGMCHAIPPCFVLQESFLSMLLYKYFAPYGVFIVNNGSEQGNPVKLSVLFVRDLPCVRCQRQTLQGYGYASHICIAYSYSISRQFKQSLKSAVINHSSRTSLSTVIVAARDKGAKTKSHSN